MFKSNKFVQTTRIFIENQGLKEKIARLFPACRLRREHTHKDLNIKFGSQPKLYHLHTPLS